MKELPRKSALSDAPIIIIGAGLSGLCLAHGLLRAGLDVQVYEKDDSAHSRKQGYRITVDGHGIAALKHCLAPDLFNVFLHTTGPSGGYFRFLNAQLDESFSLRFKPKGAGDQEAPRQVDRSILRDILLQGLEGKIHYDMAFDHATQTGNKLWVTFKDNTTVETLLLVGADGAHSKVRQQFLPGHAPLDSDFAAIYGKTLLYQNGQRLVPEALATTGINVAGTSGRAFFFTTMDYLEDPKAAFAQAGFADPVVATDPYIMWSMVMPKHNVPQEVWSHDRPALQRLVASSSGEYHPFLRRLVDAADPSFTILTTLAAGVKPQQWPVSMTTLMGDAVHLMPPFGAHGGNTALRDAALLAKEISKAVQNDQPLDAAVSVYQSSMVEYAFEEVQKAQSLMKRSMEPSAIGTWAMQQGLPFVNSLVKGRFSKNFPDVL